MRISRDADLTYCTNIHPAQGWMEVRNLVSHHSMELKKRLSSGQPFGIGLRLSDQESRELLHPATLKEFASFLQDNGLYVSLMNGYVYGKFHGAPVKTEVFAPDWRSEERALYTIRLARILERLLPDSAAGSISTAPLSYKPWVSPQDAAAMRQILHNLLRCVRELIRIESETGKRLSIDIEPEPDGLVETVAEVITFFKEWIFREGANVLARECGLSQDESCRLLRRHIGICFDACHSAIEYEEPEQSLDLLAAAGIAVGRIQLSSALTLMLPAEAIGRQLLPFADSTYLHQVVEQRSGGALRRFRDLGEALPEASGPEPRQWRIHFHVPLFTAGCGALGSTQDYVLRILRYCRQRCATRHLEIETYTWSVLPDNLKLDLTDSIEREYLWILQAWRESCEKP